MIQKRYPLYVPGASKGHKGKAGLVCLLFLAGLLNPFNAQSQTDFAPGEIMFTGYKSDDADAFSFVILAPVVSGTVIYITDRGWSNATGYRADTNGEGTISFTFGANYPCGAEFFFNDVGGAVDWSATDVYGLSAGTVAIQAGGDPDGMELGVNGGNSAGDQLSIYQLPQPTAGNQSSFVTMINMDNNLVGAVDTDEESEIPTGLAADDIVRFNLEYDNARYDCTPNLGSASTLQAAITNDNGAGGLKADNANNWIENDANTITLTACSFCCGTNAQAAAPVIDAPFVVTVNSVFTITITGTLAPGASWELYTAGCGSGTPLQTTMSNSFNVTAISTEGYTTYYVRSSEASDCGGMCDAIQVHTCNNAENMNLCATCTADPATCGDCLLPYPADNPTLDSGCYAIKLIIVLDESGSIGANAVDVKNGVLAFLNALNGQDAQVALIEFSDFARLVNGYTTNNDAYIQNITGYFNGIPYNGQTYSPGGGTNWHDAMKAVDALASADLVLFFTDGNPTCWTQANGNESCCSGGGSTETPEIVNPVKISNKIKGEGTHMFMLGVGGGINVGNLEAMSGYTNYMAGTNTLGTSDYSVGNFASLAADLANFIEELCRTDIQIDKSVLGPVCNDTVIFQFIIYNLGDESATNFVFVTDTFPAGYTPLSFYSNDITDKVCPFNFACDPPQPPGAFVWISQPVPPLSSDTIWIIAHVNPSGPYTNVAWAESDNAGDIVSDTFPGDLLTYDMPPSITCPANVTIQCNASTLPANTGMPTATDPDGTIPTISYSDVTASASCPAIKIITRTWSANDGCNPSVTCIQTITLIDTTPPVITCPANVTVLCESGTSPGITGTATGTDACDPTVTMTFTDVTVAGSCPIEYTIQRTWVATDDCNNSSTCVQTIFVDDNQPPVLTCAQVIINCSEDPSPANTGFPGVTNNCGGTSTFTYTDEFVYSPTPPQCSILRTWTATDNCGNSATCIQTIIVKDLSGPAIFCPANITIACSANTLPGNTGSATATDNCAIAPTIAYADAVVVSPTCIQNKTITRTWTAADECGNTTTCNQVITVVDNIAPAITCPANITVACTASSLPATTGSPTSSDNCDPTPDITYTDVTTAGTCPQQFTITRTWKSTDDCGNFSTCNQSIFISDNIAPVITCPSNITILCTASTMPDNTGSALATDNCDATADITYTDVTIAGACPQKYTINRTWKAQDDCGNFNTCLQTIFINDNIGPAITCPANVTIQCTASTSPENTGAPTSTDNCDASPLISSSDVITGGPCPQKYTITRTWTSTDHCGNFTTCVQTIVVEDTIAPDIVCPVDITIQCNISTLPASTGQATSTDNCDLSPEVTYADVTTAGPGCPQEYTITRTWTSADDCGNTHSCVQTITVIDTNPPVMTCPANLTIECTENTLPVATGSATATDLCDLTPTVTYTEEVSVPTGCPQEYTITRTWMAEDDCGNSATCVQTITVDDSTPPEVTCPDDLTIECTESTMPTETGSMTATDNCDLDPGIAYADITTASPDCPQAYEIARTWTATDTCGNETTCLQTITIVDTTPPEITCPADITILCTSSTLPDNTGDATATDNCDTEPDIEFTDITMSVPGTDGYEIQRLWTTTDACNNTSTCQQYILVNNPLNPEILGNTFDTICSGQTVVFEAFDQGITPITYDWNFGSGANPPSATGIGPHNVVYTYNATNGSIGAFVVLTVTTPGCPPVTDTVANVHVNSKPNPLITTSPGNPCVLGPKTFQPQAAQMPGYTYTWNFGAGAMPPTATGYGPYTIEYFTPGSKTVKLVIMTNAPGASCSDSSTLTFTVNSCPGQITGRVFLDTQTADTVGIQNVTVRLFADQNLDGLPDNATIIRSVSTNATGNYSMASITPGYYVIRETQPAGFFSLWEDDTSEDYDSLSNIVPNDDIIPITVEPNEIDTRNFFAEVESPGIISGYVFEDFNGDMSPQPAEGIPAVIITLHTDNDANGIADGGAVATAMTNSIGYYTIGGMPTGNYVLVEQQPGGYNSVKDFDATNDGDVVPNTNMMDDTIPVTLINAEVDAENFFIESTPCNQTVTTTLDNVPGSLRYAIACAQDWDTIFFHPALSNQILHLTAGRIDLNKNLYIHSTLSPTVMIKSDNGGAFQVFAGKTVEFKGINFTSGLSGFPGAQFENYGMLILWNCEVFRNPMLPPGEYLIYNLAPGQITTKGTFKLHNN